MHQILELLSERLVGKGLEIGMIPAYLRDLANTLPDNDRFNLWTLNRRMQLLGWDKIELDDHTLQLIIAYLDEDNEGPWSKKKR